jgi:hypothetical protein
MKPYFVKYTVTAVVMAEDESHAWQVARSHRSEVFGESDCNNICVEGEVTRGEQLRGGWDLQCIPYGGDGNTRIGELIAKEPA